MNNTFLLKSAQAGDCTYWWVKIIETLFRWGCKRNEATTLICVCKICWIKLFHVKLFLSLWTVRKWFCFDYSLVTSFMIKQKQVERKYLGMIKTTVPLPRGLQKKIVTCWLSTAVEDLLRTCWGSAENLIDLDDLEEPLTKVTLSTQVTLARSPGRPTDWIAQCAWSAIELGISTNHLSKRVGRKEGAEYFFNGKIVRSPRLTSFKKNLQKNQDFPKMQISVFWGNF